MTMTSTDFSTAQDFLDAIMKLPRTSEDSMAARSGSRMTPEGRWQTDSEEQSEDILTRLLTEPDGTRVVASLLVELADRARVAEYELAKAQAEARAKPKPAKKGK